MIEITPKNAFTDFLNYLNDDFDYESLEERFDIIANHLMNNLCFEVGRLAYRIVELEIYYNDEKGKNQHADPYVHCATEQLTVGEWYFNGFGLDITFGNKEENFYGGILIRGIKKLDKNDEYISGPSNVLKEIFSNLGGISGVGLGLCLRGFAGEKLEKMSPIKTTRIGLTKKDTDTQNYHKKKYRYLVEVNLQHKFKDKQKVITELLVDGKRTKEEVKNILGYNINL